MKRCPECGYRVKADELRDCPLCGVRMLSDPGGRTVRIETHVHEAGEEECLLPNTSEEEASNARYKSIMEQQLRDAGLKPTQEQINARNRYKTIMEQQLRKAGAKKQPPMPKQMRQFVVGAILVLLYALLSLITR